MPRAPRALQPAYRTIALTGARIGEFLALTRTDLLTRSHEVRLNAGKTNHEEGDRVVPVDAEAEALAAKLLPLKTPKRVRKRAGERGDA